MIGVPHEHEEGKELPDHVRGAEGRASRASPRPSVNTSPQHVAHYKIPRRFIMVQELPRTATGKILKREIRKLYQETETKSKQPHS